MNNSIPSNQILNKENQDTIFVDKQTGFDNHFGAVLWNENCVLENRLAKITKRIFDILFTLLAFFLILCWLIPLLALFIKLSSKGPVFFIQMRTGYKNKPFMCIKFRSMMVNDKADLQHAIKNDDRVTAIGYFLRKFSLDELPQFINVLLGEMSVVGPRPLMLKHIQENASQMKSFMDRHNVKPGITGLSQIKGYRGEMFDNRMLMNRLRVDLFYLSKWSLMLDILIIYKSINLML
ncbi:MAG: sugar transferase, partial [Bacteroidia bacterium]|nr:sugar transferase [Bacteroidia bacterium]